MAKCPNCGLRKLSLSRYRCETCGKRGCKRCLRAIALVDSPDFGEGRVDRWRACGRDCVRELATRLARHVAPPTLWAPNRYPSPASDESQYTCARPFRYRPRTGIAAGRTITVTWIGVTEEFFDAIRVKAQTLAQLGMIPEYTADLVAADRLKRAGRFEESAQLYEKWELCDAAGRVRQAAQVRLVRQVSVDVDKILAQARSEGLSVPFHCRSCGSTAAREDHADAAAGLRCAHCGSTYDKLELMEILAFVLG